MDRIDLSSIMNSLLAKLESAKQTRNEADEEIGEISNILRDLSGTDRDPNSAVRFIQRLQAGAARDMFDPIRSALCTGNLGINFS